MIGAGRCRRASTRHTARVAQLRITQDPAADALLGRDPLALLLGMLLDQHMRQRSSGAATRVHGEVGLVADHVLEVVGGS